MSGGLLFVAMIGLFLLCLLVMCPQRAEWVLQPDGRGRCTNCGYLSWHHTTYCPVCGCRMKNKRG